MSDTRTLEQVIEPALDTYGEALAAHTRTWDAERGHHCECGWQPKARIAERSRARSVGLHVSAEHKRASKACEAETARLMDEARKGGWR